MALTDLCRHDRWYTLRSGGESLQALNTLFSLMVLDPQHEQAQRASESTVTIAARHTAPAEKSVPGLTSLAGRILTGWCRYCGRTVSLDIAPLQHSIDFLERRHEAARIGRQ
jgi:hypothetical protein